MKAACRSCLPQLLAAGAIFSTPRWRNGPDEEDGASFGIPLRKTAAKRVGGRTKNMGGVGGFAPHMQALPPGKNARPPAASASDARIIAFISTPLVAVKTRSGRGDEPTEKRPASPLLATSCHRVRRLSESAGHTKCRRRSTRHSDRATVAEACSGRHGARNSRHSCRPA